MLKWLVCSMPFGLGWHLFWVRLVKLQGDEYTALLTASCVQALLTELAYPLAQLLCGVSAGGDAGSPCEYRENRLLETLFLLISSGFFLHDTRHWAPHWTLTSVAILVHHLGSLGLLLWLLGHGKGAHCALKLAAFMELTTPLLLLRHYQKIHRQNTRLTEYFFLFLYVLMRFVFCLRLSLSFCLKTSAPNALKLGTVFFYLSSVALFPDTVRIALGRRRERNSTKRRSISQARRYSEHVNNTQITTQTRQLISTTMDAEESGPEYQLIPEREVAASDDGDGGEVARKYSPPRRPYSATLRLPGMEDEDLLFFRSLIPYMSALPVVARLSLRSEITTAIIKAWEKRQPHPHSEED